MCEGYLFRLFATTDGKTVDDLIKEGLIHEALAMCEIEITALKEELARLEENLKEIKKKLGLEIDLQEYDAV